jgi:hypothetical protein
VKPDRLSELFDKASLKEIVDCVGPNESLTIKIARENGVEITVERQSKTNTPIGPPTLAPYELLRAAIKAVPAVKYALAVGGIVAVIAIVAGWKIDFRIAVFGVVVMLVLMTAMVVFAHLAKESASTFRAPAVVFMWFALVLTMASGLAVFLSVFLGWPADWRGLVSAQKAAAQPGQAPSVPPLVKRGAPVGTKYQFIYKQNDLDCAGEYVKTSANDWQQRISSESPAGCRVGSVVFTFTERESGDPHYFLLYDASRNVLARFTDVEKGQVSPNEWRLVSNPTWNQTYAVTRIN